MFLAAWLQPNSVSLPHIPPTGTPRAMAQHWVTPSQLWWPHSSRAKSHHSGGGHLKDMYDNWSHPEETSSWGTDHLWVWMEITADLASGFALPGRGSSSREAGMPPLLAFKSARPSLCVLGSTSRGCQPCCSVPMLATQHACGKNTAHPHSESQAPVPAESTQPLIFAEKICRIWWSLSRVYSVWGRERFLGFKEQIRPSKWLPSLNTAYLLTRPDHRVNSDSKPLTSVTTWMHLLLAAPVSSPQRSPGEERVTPAFCLCISNPLVRCFALRCNCCTYTM